MNMYVNITTFLLHISVHYTPTSGWATRISAQNHMVFTLLLSVEIFFIEYELCTLCLRGPR